MKIWEYKVIDIIQGDGGGLASGLSEWLCKSLNELGEDGWELCGIKHETFMIFKREKKNG